MTLFSRLFRRRKHDPLPVAECCTHVGQEVSIAIITDPVTDRTLKLIELDYPTPEIANAAYDWAKQNGYRLRFRHGKV